jgi:hypothetical protein
MTIETILNSDMSVAYITDCVTSPVDCATNPVDCATSPVNFATSPVSPVSPVEIVHHSVEKLKVQITISRPPRPPSPPPPTGNQILEESQIGFRTIWESSGKPARSEKGCI